METIPRKKRIGAISSLFATSKNKLIGSFAALLLAGAGIASAATPWLHTSGNRILDPNNNQTILRGVSLIDIGSQQTWDGGVNPMIDRLTNTADTQGSSPGFYTRVVRLPIFPPGQGSPWAWAPNDGDNFYNNLLRPVVNYCRTKGIYCIIDLHYIADITSANASTVQQFWAYMAPKFANDSHVIFELYNEPINNKNGSAAANWSVVKGYMQTWYNVVRQSAPNNLVLIGTPQWCQQLVAAKNSPISGTNIAYVCHLYARHWPVQWNKDQITQSAGSIPIFMTEWGFSQVSEFPVGTITNYGAPLMGMMDQHGIHWTAWVAHYSWSPAMFNSNWSLRVGENEMGGFVKDSLYSRRNSNQPANPSTGGTTPGNGTFKIVNRNSGKALDAGGTANGTQITQWTYSGANNQRWTLLDRGSSQFSIIGVASGKALEANGSGTANGTKIQLWTYGGGNNQKWKFTATSGGFYRVTPVHASGGCLDVNGNSTANGALVQLWTYGGGNNQQWSFTAP